MTSRSSNINLKYISIILLIILLNCTSEKSTVRVGLDHLGDYSHLFQGRRIGIICNQTTTNSHRKHIINIIHSMKEMQISAIFAPEHGLLGNYEAGDAVPSSYDPSLKVNIYSLHGKNQKPTAEMLKNVDILVFDIQDIGCRFFTIINTMALAMDAAAQQGIPFVVLDRPNMLSGQKLEGNLLESAYTSFVGMYPIPILYGMTIGELAKMLTGENWLKNSAQTKLTVVPLKNWKREYFFDQTGLVFIKPSPNISDFSTALVYPGICLLEGTNISEGRGTYSPFLIFGAPWINSFELKVKLMELNLPGVLFRDTVFTPISLPGLAAHPKFQDTLCFGLKIIVENRTSFLPYRTGIFLVKILYHLYPQFFKWRTHHFDLLCGSSSVRETILTGGNVDSLINNWQENMADFEKMRKKYLIYE